MAEPEHLQKCFETALISSLSESGFKFDEEKW